MKTGFSVGMALLLWTSVASATQCYAPSEGYNFLCRGKMSLEQQVWTLTGAQGGFVTIYYGQSATKAGPFGEYLKPGTCAWQDRPTTPDEPVTAHIDWENLRQFAVSEMVQRCLMDRDCVVDVCARTVTLGNYNPPRRVINLPYGWHAQTYYPTFRN